MMCNADDLKMRACVVKSEQARTKVCLEECSPGSRDFENQNICGEERKKDSFELLQKRNPANSLELNSAKRKDSHGSNAGIKVEGRKGSAVGQHLLKSRCC